MIYINGEAVENIEVVYKTWTKDGNKYTSAKGTIIWLGDECELGDWCKLGNRCELGDGCKIGDECKIGYGCELGDWCKIGDECELGDWCKIGDECKLGNGCKLGYECELGDWCKLGDECKANYPLWFCGIRFSIGFYSAGIIASGCIIKPVKWWEENITACAKEHGYTPEQIKEYEWRVKTLVDWMKLHGLYEMKGGK